MTATTPQLVVQVCPGQGPMVDITDGQWVTLTTSAVVDTSFRHGRNSEFDTFSAGTLTVTFEDRTRAFDPLNASGAYFGDLNPGMHVRVLARIGLTDYPRWRGFVESILTTNAKTTTFVTLTASDAFKILNQTKLPQSVYETVVLDDDPWFYWKLGEADGETAADSSGNRNDGVFADLQTVDRGAPAVVSYANDGSVRTTAPAFAPVRSTDSAAVLQTRPMTIEMWLRADDQSQFGNGPSENFFLYCHPRGVTATGIEVQYGVVTPSVFPFRTISVRDAGASPTNSTWQAIPNLHDGAAHHVVIVCESGGHTLYIDGVQQTVSFTASGTVRPGDPYVFVGMNQNADYITPHPSFGSTWCGSIDDLAVYDAALTSTQVTDHWEASRRPWDGDTTGERIERILDLIGWPAGPRAIDPGEKTLGPADLAGATALEYCQLVAQSEGGRFFIDVSGNVTFHDAGRFERETVENTSQYTFSDDEAGDAVYSGGSFSRDDTLVYNQASIQRKYGLPQTAEDSTSITAYGPRTYSLSGLLHQSDAIARSQAESIVYRYKDPQSRVAQLTLQPDLDAASWVTILGLEVGHRVTVEQKPANTGTQIQIDQHIEHIAEQINGGAWTITFQLSPVDPHEDDYLIWGTGLWGTNVWR